MKKIHYFSLFLSLLCLLPHHSIGQQALPLITYLQIVETRQGVGESGDAMFFVTMKNTNREGLEIGGKVAVILTNNGLVVGIYFRYFSLDSEQEKEIEILTDQKPEKFNSMEFFIHEFLPDNFDESLAVGDVWVDSMSVNLLPDDKGNIVVLGSLINGTNAYIQEVVLRIALYDAEDRYIGNASVTEFNGNFWSSLTDLAPGINYFSAENNEIPWAKVEGWSVELLFYTPSRLKAPPIPTVRKGMGWGEIKRERLDYRKGKP